MADDVGVTQGPEVPESATSDLDAVCERLGITLLPWQRQYAEAVLNGEQAVSVRGRKVGWTTVQRVIEMTKED